MIHRVLSVGINKYMDSSSNLRGCVGDVERVWYHLLDNYGFDPELMRAILDNRATKANMLDRMAKSVLELQPGEAAVWHYSGHGSQVRDRHNDELLDGMDEILCPHDMNWDDPLKDDDISKIVGMAKPGTSIIFICDSCHSGTIDRVVQPEEFGCYRKQRFMVPPLDIELRSRGRKFSWKWFARLFGRPYGGATETQAPKGVGLLLLSGCKDDQTSEEGVFNGEVCGVLTTAFIKATKEKGLTWRKAHERVCEIVSKWGYEQEPQLSGNMLDRKVFE